MANSVEYMKQYFQEHKYHIAEQQRAYNQEHKERIAEQKRKYNLEHKEHLAECKKKYAQEHRVHLNECRRRCYQGLVKENQERYRLKHREQTREWMRGYYVRNRDKLCKCVKQRYHSNRYLAKAISCKAGMSLVPVIQRVYEDNIKKFGTLTCYLCLEPIEFGQDQLEHKTPVSRGGTHTYENLGVSCPTCNRKKGQQTEEEYRCQIQ